LRGPTATKQSQIPAQAIWIASLTLASTPPFFVTTGLVRVVHAAMQPTKTIAVSLSKPALRMDCRVKPGQARQ